MNELTLEERIGLIENQIHVWKSTQFDAIIAKRVAVKLGEKNERAEAAIVRAEKALAFLDEELKQLVNEGEK